MRVDERLDKQSRQKADAHATRLETLSLYEMASYDSPFFRVAEMSCSASPLLIFVHAPKTAGTTISRALNLCSYRGFSHCQNQNFQTLRAYAERADWLSGHLTRQDFETAFEGVPRSFEFFSSVREPLAHVISFVNWHFEAVKRGLAVKHGVVARVHETNYSDPGCIIRLLDEHADFLLNCQSRYIVGRDFSDISLREFESRITAYRYIAYEGRLSELYDSFGFEETPPGIQSLRENASDEYFDRTAFKSPELQAFLKERNAFDEALYQIVRSHFGPSQAQSPSRPSDYQCGDATEENFDEERYLDGNPELIRAVGLNGFASGAEHFRLYGFAERRLTRSGKRDSEFSQLLRDVPLETLPLLYHYVVPTGETFDEEGYLIANPDVAAAVKRGQVKSGRHHFRTHGRAEGRLMRVLANRNEG